MGREWSGQVWFSTELAAEYSGWSTKTIVRALRAGELKGAQRKAGARWRIHRDDLDTWLRGTSSDS